jgi:hypothetical protein
MVLLLKDLVAQFNSATSTNVSSSTISNTNSTPIDEAFALYEKLIRDLERKLPVLLEEIKVILSVPPISLL